MGQGIDMINGWIQNKERFQVKFGGVGLNSQPKEIAPDNVENDD